MAKDQFGRELVKGDQVIIDAVVEEAFEEHIDPEHVRVTLTNGPRHSIVLKAVSVMKAVVADETTDDNAKNGFAFTYVPAVVDVEKLTAAAYNAYGESVKWKTFKGDEMKPFEDAPEKVRTAWIAATSAIVHEFRPDLAPKPADSPTT